MAELNDFNGLILISNQNIPLLVDINNPILNTGFFAIIDKSVPIGLDFELLKIIFCNDFENVTLEKLVDYVPIISSLSLPEIAF